MKEIKGTQGFGYDPIFVPDGFSESFAEMNLEQKTISVIDIWLLKNWLNL